MTTASETTKISYPSSNWGIRGFAVEALCLLALATCAGLSSFVASSVAALAVFAGYAIFVFLKQPSFYLKYLPFMFSVIANIIGCAICEFSDFDLYELKTTCGFVGSLPLLVLSRWLFVAILFVADRRLGVQTKMLPDYTRKSAPIKDKILIAAEVTTFALVALLLLHVIAHPSFLEDLDRFGYDAAYMTGIWGPLDAAAPYLMAFPILAIRCNRRRALGIATVVLFCLYLFWTGEKFGGFFTIACLFAYAFYDCAISLSTKKTVAIGAIMILVSVTLIGTALIANSLVGRQDAANYLPQRVAQQGQLWWKTFDQARGEIHSEDFQSEINALFKRDNAIKDSIGSDNGIYRIMYYTAPESTVDRKLASGSRYTEGGYAAMYYYFGALGPLAYSCCMAALIFLVQNALIRALWTRNPIKMIIFPYFSQACRTGMSMLLFYRFTGRIAILSYLYLALDAIIRRFDTRKTRQQAEQKGIRRLLEKARIVIQELDR